MSFLKFWRSALAVIVVVPLPGRVWAWDDGGHMLVGEIAARRLRADVAVQVATLAALLDRTYNGGQPYNLVTAGTWMDDMRKMPNYPWGAWHYINVPCRGPSDFMLPEPPPPHALWAIQQARSILRTPGTDLERRAVALGQLIHLVGDIHQPLHASDWKDHGGTSYLIAPLILSLNGPKTLHAFWDAAYRYSGGQNEIRKLWDAPGAGARPAGARVPGVIAEQATALLASYPPERLTASLAGAGEPTAPRLWALESHKLGCASGWPPGPHPAEYEVGRLSPQFVATAHDIAAQRIVLAGCRLAELLNRLFRDQP